MSHKTAVPALQGNLLRHRNQRRDGMEITFQSGPSEMQGAVTSRRSEGTFRTATNSTLAINNGTQINCEEDPWSSADSERRRGRDGRESSTRWNGHVALASIPKTL